MRKRSAKLFSTILLTTLAGCDANCSAGEVTVGGTKVHEDKSVPKTYELDKRYAEKHGYELPAKLSFEGPRGNLQEHNPPKEEGIFLRVNYFGEDGQPSEDFLITTFNLPPGAPADQRMGLTENLVKEKGLPSAMSGKGQQIGTQGLTISGMPAIAGAGQLEDEKLGTVFAAVFAIPLPDSEMGIAIVSHHVKDNSEIKTPDDIGKKGAMLQVLETMKVEPLEG